MAPIRNQSGNEDVPVELIREAFASTLIDRLYSPLGLDYVDVNWVDSSFGGTPAPDALLVVALTEWDDMHLYSTGIVSAAADLFLFEGGSTTGAHLWGLTLRREIDVGQASRAERRHGKE